MDALRLSDADREAAVDLLGEQYAVGRLSRDEFDERSDAVWSARTRGDLAPIFADLPVQSSATTGPDTGADTGIHTSGGASSPTLVAVSPCARGDRDGRVDRADPRAVRAPPGGAVLLLRALAARCLGAQSLPGSLPGSPLAAPLAAPLPSS